MDALLDEELPYSVTVEIEQFVTNDRGGYDIHGLILVEREGQKKMVIGNKGAKIKNRYGSPHGYGRFI